MGGIVAVGPHSGDNPPVGNPPGLLVDVIGEDAGILFSLHNTTDTAIDVTLDVTGPYDGGNYWLPSVTVPTNEYTGNTSATLYFWTPLPPGGPYDAYVQLTDGETRYLVATDLVVTVGNGGSRSGIFPGHHGALKDNL